MKLVFYALTVVIGIVLTVHLAMNGKVGATLNNPRVANALFWCVGALTAVLIGLSGWEAGTLRPLREIHPVLLMAGVFGACLVFGIAFLIPRIGAGRLTLIMLAGQIVGGLVLSHFGWLGSPREPVTARGLVGTLIMFAGVILASR
ncbi:DMT family transporter [Edaphobacter sp. 12200R-103]|jgi:transporter family-2 protein|uniref:DMT family transporter n=1 Tax=Edaphobacter sp. 12200R-103 TaxID=2703788 RepID=UPI00138BB9AA|nr:DMT family transporter [Edaphobacter sp. 12200R-103]QHS53323.1 DMT family transporter [Edaphobacter sp. 12200R-103]